MASLGDALVTKILGHSAAEKAFRPWWDNLEDFLVYGLVMLGLVVAPTAIINGTPLDCNFCRDDHCQARFNNTPEQVDPQFSAWWVKKYCTVKAVDGFIMYFPYILLIIALVIVLVERVFVRMFKAGLKLDMFYNLLVKDALEDVDPNTANDKSGTALDLENSKTALEVSESFAQSSNYFLSYFIRTIAEFVLAGVLLAWLLLRGLPSIQKDEYIFCDVHGYWYECAGHPQQFYMYVLFIVLFILMVYMLCCFWNILWLTFPRLGTLSGVMKKYHDEARKSAKDGIKTDKEILGDLYTIYYHNRDLKLLLDLLAESSGIAPSIRIMSLFDQKFRARSEPKNLKVTKEENGVEVQFEDAEVMSEIFRHIKQVACIYTVEIQPATKNSSVMAFKSSYDAGKPGEKHVCAKAGGDTELQPLTGNSKKAWFTDLDPSKEYTIRVSTVLNGKMIARRLEAIKPTEE